MKGFNPIKSAGTVETPERSLNKNIKEAVSLVASAMQRGMLDSEDIALLENGGIRKIESKQSAFETFEDMLGMAQAVKLKIMDGDRVQVDDPAELAKLVGVVVKLMEMVRKSLSEARRVEELTALETSLHNCMSDIQDAVEDSPELRGIVDSAMKTMLRNLEDRLKQVQAKYEE